MTGQHQYGDWIRHKSGHVAVITSDEKLGFCNWLIKAQFAHNGKIEAMTIFDYDYITEYEFYEQFDPKRCGEPMRFIADVYQTSATVQDDWFTGGKMKSGFTVKEDFFA
jgi:hypothetical protein